MSIFNYKWKHNNNASQLIMPVKKLKPFPFSLVVLMTLASGAVYYQSISLSQDIMPQLQCL